MSLRKKFATRLAKKPLFITQSVSFSRNRETSYEISLLIAKFEKNHTIGMVLFKS